MSHAQHIVEVLSTLIGISDIIIKDHAMPVDLAGLVDLDTQIDDARAIMIEGGNPIGAEASMLIECLAHVGRSRQTFERALETKWLAIAAALLPMVQENLAEALELLKMRPADRVARGGQYR
jgi:hypothetical protein